MTRNDRVLQCVSSKLFPNTLLNPYHRNMAKLVLSCFVLGSALKFSVGICDLNTISDSNSSREIPFNILTIGYLKKMIYREQQDSFGQIDPNMLILWKVKGSKLDNEIRDLKDRIRELERNYEHE